MKTFARISLIALLLLMGATGFSGCRTAHGFGEDMEHAGQNRQDKTQ